MTDLVITPAKEEHGCDSGSESLDKHKPSCIVMLKDVISVSLLRKWQNDRIKNIAFVFYGIQCSLGNFELSMTIVINSSSDHNTSASKTVRLLYTLVRKTFPTSAVHTITFIAKAKQTSGLIIKKYVLTAVKPATTMYTSPG